MTFPPNSEPHVVSGVLKLWFRELPEPLLTYALYDHFLQAMQSEDLSYRLQCLKSGIDQLPKHNQNLLQYMVSFLGFISQFEEENKMNSRNLSIVFAPTFLSPPGALDPSSLKQVYLVVEDFVANYDFLFRDIEESRRIYAEKQRAREAAMLEQKKIRQEMIASLIEQSSSGAASTSNVLSAAAYSDLPLKQGYLSKKGANRRNWTTRWFMLKSSCLLYYKSPTEINEMPKGKIFLSSDCIIFSWDKKKFGFCVYTPDQDRIYYICAKNQIELDEWMEEMSKLLTFSPVIPPHLIKRVE